MQTYQSKDEFVIGKHNIGYVSDRFRDVFKDTEFEAVTSVPTFQKLPRWMTDREIESDLKPGLCTLGDVIAFLDNAPAECKDGYWNLFYLADSSFVVHVYWDGSNWGVITWERGGRDWNTGDRVFSPATGSQPLSSTPSDSLPLELEINGVTYRRV